MKLTVMLYATVIGLLFLAMSSKCQETTGETEKTESVTTEVTTQEATSLLYTIGTIDTTIETLATTGIFKYITEFTTINNEPCY